MSDDTENPRRIAELREILWAHIQDLDQVRRLKRRPSLERRLKVVHALSQLSASYLKVVEVNAVLETVPELQAQMQEVLRASRNGHRHTTALAGLN
jgi:hypothetical protein